MVSGITVAMRWKCQLVGNDTYVTNQSQLRHHSTVSAVFRAILQPVAVLSATTNAQLKVPRRRPKSLFPRDLTPSGELRHSGAFSSGAKAPSLPGNSGRRNVHGPAHVSGNRYRGFQRPARRGQLRRQDAVAQRGLSLRKRPHPRRRPPVLGSAGPVAGCLPGPAGVLAMPVWARSPASASTPGASISVCSAAATSCSATRSHYRDSRTDGLLEEAFELVPREGDLRPHRLAVHAVQHALSTVGHASGRLTALGRAPNRC